MSSLEFNTKVIWTGNRGSGTMDYRSFEKTFTLKIDGKKDIEGSAAVPYHGDPDLHNPQDLLVASASSCHMLWYLHLCSVNDVIVLEYIDEAVGIMKDNVLEGGHFEKIQLRPKIVINNGSNIEKAKKLHDVARRKCYIANSFNFPVEHEVTVTAQR